jgi:hypothetical protein
VILRSLTVFEAQGASGFFGEPEFDTAEFLRTAEDGRGVVSVLELPAVQERPQLFSTFLMRLLADLFHDLPEVGDVDRPKLVSSSTRRICCSTTPPTRSWTRSPGPCG